MDGGATAFDRFADASESQWYNACSAGGQRSYPYGNERVPGLCNTFELHTGATTPVGILPECQSRSTVYEGVMDLSGNVWEWEDACSAQSGADDFCRVRGGSFNSDEDTLPCKGDHTYFRAFASFFVGFRCCTDGAVEP